MLTWPNSVLGLIEYACNVEIDETTHFRALMQRLLNGRVYIYYFQWICRISCTYKVHLKSAPIIIKCVYVEYSKLLIEHMQW